MRSLFYKTIREFSSKFLLALFFILFSRNVLAQDQQFSIDYNLDYNINEDGEATITHEATIANLKNDVIPTTYSFSAKQLKIYDVSAETNGKKANPKVEEKDGESLVSVVIDNYAIGEGRQNKISLTYKTKSIASQSGKIWNIYIPRIQIPTTTTLYNVKLSVPASFGPKIYLSPTPVIERFEDGKNVYYFTKENFNSTGIIAAMGEYQPVNFKLKYQLKNNSILPSIKEIALPTDISESQSVSYLNLNPKPLKIKVDSDGNLIASYVLGPLKTSEIEATGTARLYGRQINPDFGRSFSEIPSEISKKYTKPQKYWETESEYIKELVEEIKDDNLNVAKNAQNIYEFITRNLTYDFEAIEKGMVERKGAEAVLSQKGSWTCMEFTDLFVATARAMGIPAREINGYAFAFDDKNKPISISLNSGDYLHSWVEFYDPFYGWVQVDPTWGTTSGIDYFTKLDTNHFAFVIKGLSSEYPYPAGTYRLSESEKLIEVALSQTTVDEDFVPTLEVKKATNFNPIQAFKNKIKIEIKNIGRVNAYKIDGKILPIKSTMKFYIDEEAKEINFEDINGKKYSTPISW